MKALLARLILAGLVIVLAFSILRAQVSNIGAPSQGAVMIQPASAVNGAGVLVGALTGTGSIQITGNVQAALFVPTAGVMNSAGTLFSGSAFLPTVSSGFGTSPAVVTPNGSASFTVNVGTGGVASSGVVAMGSSSPATTGWNCWVRNLTAQAANRGDQETRQTASTTTTATFQNQTISTGAALAWTASDILRVSCFGF